ncbi:hypothetical protein RHDC4_01332 [Rhodocyclaceae bacterium]|nr:hypothetical protein RHDC4_01332 [Rhodocyclaceae bacterium]
MFDALISIVVALALGALFTAFYAMIGMMVGLLPIPFWVRARLEAAGITVAPSHHTTGISEAARMRAAAVLDQHGLRAYFYLPSAGMQDRELADACRFLAGAGNLIMDADDNMVGKVAALYPTSDEVAVERRASFRLVYSERGAPTT